jgi:hypothetical protein
MPNQNRMQKRQELVLCLQKLLEERLKAEHADVTDQLGQEQRKIIRQFTQIIAEYTHAKKELENDLATQKKDVTTKLNSRNNSEQARFQTVCGELNGKLSKISSNRKKAKEFLETHWREVISEPKIDSHISIKSGDDPKAALEQCIRDSTILLEKIQALSKEPIPLTKKLKHYTTWYGNIFVCLVSWMIGTIILAWLATNMNLTFKKG